MVFCKIIREAKEEITPGVKEKHILRDYFRKFYIQSLTLEVLIDRKEYKSLEIYRAISEGFTYDIECRVCVRDIEIYMAELEKLKLIEKTKTEYDEKIDKHILFYKITDKGFEILQNQTYQSVSASLFSARQTKRLSIIAITISLIAVVTTIYLFLIGSSESSAYPFIKAISTIIDK